MESALSLEILLGDPSPFEEEETEIALKAEPILDAELHRRELALGPDDISLCPVLNRLSECLALLDRMDEALQLLRRVLQIREKALGPDHLDVSLALRYVAARFGYFDQHKEAEPLLRRALLILETQLEPEDL